MLSWALAASRTSTERTRVTEESAVALLTELGRPATSLRPMVRPVGAERLLASVTGLRLPGQVLSHA